jgi:DNA-binding CsgD family transcriptional regulator
MLVHRPGKSALRVMVSPFRGSLPGRSKTLAALLFVSDPTQLVSSRAETLRALYGMTPTECRVADMLLEGLELREIAGRMHITLETTRFHVKRVLAKSGARRQSEFIRLMLALPGTLLR